MVTKIIIRLVLVILTVPMLSSCAPIDTFNYAIGEEFRDKAVEEATGENITGSAIEKIFGKDKESEEQDNDSGIDEGKTEEENLKEKSSNDTLLYDDFDNLNDYKTTDPDYFYIEDSSAVLNLDRDRPQVLYRNIPSISGDILLSFKAILVDTTNNCEIDIGFSDSNPSENNIENGVVIRFGWRGGDNEHETGTYICNSWIINGKRAYSGLSERIWVEKNEWYVIEVYIRDNEIEIQVFDEANNCIGDAVSIYSPITTDFSYLFIANFDVDDWPTGLGYLDYIEIKELSK